jgi:hypothetical protein
MNVVDGATTEPRIAMTSLLQEGRKSLAPVLSAAPIAPKI